MTARKIVGGDAAFLASGAGHGAIREHLETFIFHSRWLLAPFYLGLIVALAALLYKFIVLIIEFVLHVRGATESDVILGVLTLVDLTFTANLVLIVIFSGYENFVSRIDVRGDHDRPEWMTKVDFGGLKQKLMTSIVAISAIQVLKAFMNIGSIDRHDDARAGWSASMWCS